MTFRELIFSEDVIRKDKTYCEIELSDGNNIFIEKRNNKFIFNCTKPLLTFTKEEFEELNSMVKAIK